MSEHSKDQGRRRPKNGPERVRSDIGPWAMIPRWVMRRCSPGELMVYMELSLRADRDTNECWPSWKTICEDTGMSRATVARHLESLRRKGCIDWDQRDRKDGGQTSNVYTVFYAERPDPRLTSETPPRLMDETPPVSPVRPLEQEPVDQSQMNKNHSSHLAVRQDEGDESMAIGGDPSDKRERFTPNDHRTGDASLDQVTRAGGVGVAGVDRPRVPVDVALDRFRDRTAAALIGRGIQPKTLMLAFNRAALGKSFKAMRKTYGLSYRQIHDLIDQWAIDIETKRITIPDGVPAWKYFLTQLEQLQARHDQRSTSGKSAAARSSVTAELAAAALALIEEN